MQGRLESVSMLLRVSVRSFVDQLAGVEIILPVDFTCSSKFGEDGEIKEGRNKRCARSSTETLRACVSRKLSAELAIYSQSFGPKKTCGVQRGRVSVSPLT